MKSCALICLFGFAALPFSSYAAPVTIDKSQAVGDARRDQGTGLCGTAINYKNMRLVEITEAIDILNAPKTDMRIIGRTSVLFDNINFRNNYLGGSGDFTSPDAPDSWLPYSSAPMSMPQGNDANIAFRLRGYLNITSTNGGQPIALGINCNDACSLRIGKSKMELVRADDDDAVLTGTRVRQVIFKDTGLYPVEMIYFQNANEAFLEWARTNMPVSGEGSSDGPPAGDAVSTFDKSRWKIITGTDLFSSIVGSNPACQECGAVGTDCSGIGYCGDGLCQPCNVPDHCGPTCQQCPTDARLCQLNKCVQCTSDAMCSPGTSCVDGRCGPPTPCTSDNDCKAQGKICDPDEHLCKIPPMICQGDGECPAGQECESGFCRVKPTPCSRNAQCFEWQYCDTSEGVCKAKNPFQFGGGCLGNPAATPDPDPDRCDPMPLCPPDGPCAPDAGTVADGGSGVSPAAYRHPRQRICGCTAANLVPRLPSSRYLMALIGASMAWLSLRQLRRNARWRRSLVEGTNGRGSFT